MKTSICHVCGEKTETHRNTPLKYCSRECRRTGRNLTRHVAALRFAAMDRMLAVIKFREDGRETYKQLGARFGVSATRIQQILRQAERMGIYDKSL